MAMLAEHGADEDTDLGLGTCMQRPINPHTLVDMRNPFSRDDLSPAFMAGA